jgi:hypothetical protein
VEDNPRFLVYSGIAQRNTLDHKLQHPHPPLHASRQPTLRILRLPILNPLPPSHPLSTRPDLHVMLLVELPHSRNPQFHNTNIQQRSLAIRHREDGDSTEDPRSEQNRRCHPTRPGTNHIVLPNLAPHHRTLAHHSAVGRAEIFHHPVGDVAIACAFLAVISFIWSQKNKEGRFG